MTDETEPVVVGKRDRQSRAVRWERLDEDTSYAGSQLDHSVVAKDQIRTVVRELRDKLFTAIFPGRTEIPKTLFFAKNDNHAEDLLDVIRSEFAIGNEEAVKVTYKPERAVGDGKKLPASAKPEALIQRFRNSYQPRIAVTVDMIATGTDIKPLECVVFMRSVKSSGLFEQMKGRGVRVMPDADFQAVTPDAKVKTHFVIVDAVGVMEEHKSEPPLLRERSVAFDKLLEVVRMGSRNEDVLSTLAARLDRMERRLTPDQKQAIERDIQAMDRVFNSKKLTSIADEWLPEERSDESIAAALTADQVLTGIKNVLILRGKPTTISTVRKLRLLRPDLKPAIDHAVAVLKLTRAEEKRELWEIDMTWKKVIAPRLDKNSIGEMLRAASERGLLHMVARRIGQCRPDLIGEVDRAIQRLKQG